jgi:farnesyl-diphosphate farnesyltransferase
MSIQTDILRVLKGTSRTFAIPITRLPGKLGETISAAYLCMRALDEIEDDISLENKTKVTLLRNISASLQAHPFSGINSSSMDLEAIFAPYKSRLPEVTLRLGEWLSHSPSDIAPRILDASSSIAERMAYWAERKWLIQNEADLNAYTFSVAGAVGLLLCDIWAWFDGTQLDRVLAVHFGRGLQSVNILRNREEDLQRKVDFFPVGWTQKEMIAYARKFLDFVKLNIKTMPVNAYERLVKIPFYLAEATLNGIERGQKKLSRAQVLSITGQG